MLEMMYIIQILEKKWANKTSISGDHSISENYRGMGITNVAYEVFLEAYIQNILDYLWLVE
jgi:hypothetical protein